jgi:uncharacterized membrane protein
MSTVATAASSGVPLMASLMGWLFLLALFAAVLGVPYLAFKAWQNGRDTHANEHQGCLHRLGL